MGIACVLSWPALKATDGYPRVSICLQKASDASRVNRFYGWICTRREFEMNMIEMEYNLTRQECRLLPAGVVALAVKAFEMWGLLVVLRPPAPTASGATVT